MANPFDQFDDAPASSAGNPFDQFDAPKAAMPTGGLSSNAEDGAITSTAKSLGTAAIKGLSNSVGTVGNLGNFADYLLARGHSAITGKPVEDVVAGYAQTRKDQAAGSVLGRVREAVDPSKVLPSGEDVSAPILKRTGEYVPESELGKMGQAGAEAVFGMVGPGGGAASRSGPITATTTGAEALLRTPAALAPVNYLAGVVGQGATDATGDPLLGMAAGMVAPGVASAAKAKVASGVHRVTEPFAEDLPIIGNRYAGQRDQMVRDRLLSEAQDPVALEQSLFPGPRRPGGDEIIPGSEPTTGQLTGDMGILGAERRAITSDNTDFNIRSTEQDAARRAELAKAAPDADSMKPSQFFQDQLAHIERGADEAVNRIQSGAQDLAGRLGAGESPENLGASIRNPIQAVYNEAKKARTALYNAVDPDGSVALVASPVRDRGQELLKGIDTYDAPLKPDEARIFGRISSLPDVMPFKSLIALDKDIYAAMSGERRSAGETPTWGRLSQLKSAVMGAINDAVDNQSAYERAAVASGKMRPEDTIQGRLEGIHGEYGGALGVPPRNTGTTGLDNAAVGASGVSKSRGEAGEGNVGLGNAARAERVPAEVPENVAAPQNLNDYPIYYPGGQLRARYEVVDHPDLVISHDQNFNSNPTFPQELQPRVRESAPARDQVNGMASRLQPERLGPSPEANSGAPIVGPDGVVESGNGRAMAIGQAYRKGNPAYRQWLEGQGFDTRGLKQPVLIARRTSEMSPAQREYFTNSANSAAGLKMSAAEQAVSDAKLLNSATLEVIADAPIRSPDNRDFVRSFAGKLPANERGGILDQAGNLSQTGVRRIEGALASKAYDDAAFVGRAFDSADSNIRNLAGALVDAAGPWAKMREAARSGAIDGSHDITHELMDVVHKVMRARDEGRPIADILKQNDMFGSDVKPLVESLLFRNVDNGVLAARPRIASGLRAYATEAEKNLAGPRLFGEDVQPRDVLKTAISKAAPDAEDAVTPTFETGAAEPVRGLQPNFDRSAADRLGAAKESHKSLAETFRNPVIKPVLKTLGGAHNYQLPTASIPSRAVVKGDRGYQTAKDFLKAAKSNPEVVSAMQDRALSPLRTSLKPDGTINSAKFDNWKRDYAGVLKALDDVDPGFSKRFDNAAKASDLLVEAGVKREKILADAQKNAAAKFMKTGTVSEVEDALGAILQSKTGPSQMKDLIARSKGNQEVIDGLRKAGIDWMTRKFAASVESGTSGEKKIQKGMFDKFVRNNATTLGELYPAEQVNLFRALARDMDRSSRVLATNVAGSPGTAKDIQPALEKLMKAAGEHKTLAGAVGGALVAGLYHTGSMTAALSAAGLAVPAYLIKTMRAAGINKVEDMFRDALLHPERARYYLAKIPPSAPVDSGPMFALNRLIRRGLVTAPVVDATSKYPAKKAA